MSIHKKKYLDVSVRKEGLNRKSYRNVTEEYYFPLNWSGKWRWGGLKDLVIHVYCSWKVVEGVTTPIFKKLEYIINIVL